MKGLAPDPMAQELTFISEDQIGRRRSRRREVCLHATLEGADGKVMGFVSDISETGAKLAANDSGEQGEVVFLEIEGYRFEGRIVWREGKAAGISFDDDIPTEIVNLLAKLSGRK